MVLEKIRTDKPAIHSRVYFVGKIIALMVVSFAVLAISILLFNFIFFSLRINGQESLLAFGGRGLLTFLRLFPWSLLVIDVVLVLLLEKLLRQFRFGYKSPVLYLLAAILVLTVSIGLFIDRGTRFNDDLLQHADRHELPWPLGEFFEKTRQASPDLSGVCKCTITSIQGSTFGADDIDPDSIKHYSFTLSPSDPIIPTLHVGDMVLVAGDTASDTIQVFGIRKLIPHLRDLGR